MNIQFSGEFRDEILKLDEKRREKLLEKLKVPASKYKKLSTFDVTTIRSSMKIDDILNASRKIKENVEESLYAEEKTKDMWKITEKSNRYSEKNYENNRSGEKYEEEISEYENQNLEENKENSETESFFWKSQKNFEPSQNFENFLSQEKNFLSQSFGNSVETFENSSQILGDSSGSLGKCSQVNLVEGLSQSQSFISDYFFDADKQSSESACELDQKSFYTPEACNDCSLLCPHNTFTSCLSDETRSRASFLELEAAFVENVTKKLEKIPSEAEEKSTENTHSVTSLHSTPSSRLITKLREMLRGSKASSFIDDVSSPKLVPSRAFEPNLIMPEISPNEVADSRDAESCHETSPAVNIQETRKSHEDAVTHHLSQTSNFCMQATSTFMSPLDIFKKTMTARRNRLAEDEDEIIVDSGRGISSCSDIDLNNECIKHVLNFDE